MVGPAWTYDEIFAIKNIAMVCVSTRQLQPLLNRVVAVVPSFRENQWVGERHVNLVRCPEAPILIYFVRMVQVIYLRACLVD